MSNDNKFCIFRYTYHFDILFYAYLMINFCDNFVVFLWHYLENDIFLQKNQ